MKSGGSKNAERLLRDLKWSIASAPIVDSSTFTESAVIAYDSDFWIEAAQASQKLLEDEKTPEQLLSHVQKARQRHRNNSLRLGIYFETLLEFWLVRAEQFEILASHRHVSIRDAQATHSRTLGEVDWIVSHRWSGKKRNEHWECALKFYLITQDATRPEQLVGPDRQDTLARKLSHMVDHQLKIKIPEFEPTLPVCIIKGRVFIEWLPGNSLWASVAECARALPLSNAPRLRQLSANAEAGMVVSETNFTAFHEALRFPAEGATEPKKVCYFPLAKDQWLSPLFGADFFSEKAMNFEDVTASLKQDQERPVMFAVCGQSKDGLFEEKYRFFLKPHGDG